MTSILRHDPASTDSPVRALDWSAFERNDEVDAADANPAISALRAEIARLDAELAELKQGEPDRIAAARAEGRKDAERSYRANDEAKLAALRAGLDTALETARPIFANVERLAFLLAERAIANAFDNADLYRKEIASAIRRESGLLGAQAILSVEVSRSDFADDHSLTELTLALKLDGSVGISARDDLEQGQARLRLMLGEIELDLPRYWTEVKALLTELGATS